MNSSILIYLIGEKFKKPFLVNLILIDVVSSGKSIRESVTTALLCIYLYNSSASSVYGGKIMDVLHEPQLDTILMVEGAIKNSKVYPKRTELWRSLPRKVQYQTFKRILEYLEASGKIIFNDAEIIYTGGDNPKLRALIESSVRII